MCGLTGFIGASTAGSRIDPALLVDDGRLFGRGASLFWGVSRKNDRKPERRRGEAQEGRSEKGCVGKGAGDDAENDRGPDVAGEDQER